MGNRSCRALCAAALVLAIATPRAGWSQVNGVHMTVTPWAGFLKYANNTNLENEKIFGATLGLNFHRYVGIEAHVGRTDTETNDGTTPWTPTPNLGVPVGAKVLSYGGNLILNLRPSAWFVPFLTAGWQESRIQHDLTPEPPEVFENGIQFGGGVKLRIHPRMAIRAEVRDALWKFDGAPTPPGEDATDNLTFSGGLEFALGGVTGPRAEPVAAVTDADNDGVPDGTDQCPNTPMGARVDARGCPLDSDNDRVFDGIDQCPDTPANAVVDERGCPRDTDNDGVPDGIDQCADTPAGTAVDARGCPQVIDSDRDGVPDDRDRCPFTPANAQVDAEGCPIELSEREVELLDKGVITEREIHFETAKWDILPHSHATLDAIGNILIQWPQLRIEIGGHADHRGSDAYNLDLSEKRANAVREYLQSKFPTLSGDKLSARGYGERQPVATNRTVEGMARNRRVEFKVLNTEELVKERERRRTLQRNE